MASIAQRAAQAATAAPARKGRDAETPAQIPAPGWKEIAFRTWKESSKDNVSLVAAGVAFYGFLAMVPLLGATVLTYGLLASPQAVLHNVSSLATMLPQDVAKLVGDQLLNVVKTSGGKKGLGVLVALAVALWGARNAAGSLIIALNIAYEEEEKRGWVKVTLLSLAITAAAVVLGMLGAAAVGAMAALENILPGLGGVGVIAGKVLTYVILAAVAAAAAATLYRYGPSRAKAKWTWITPEGEEGDGGSDQPLSDDPGARQSSAERHPKAAEMHEHPYITARLTNRGGSLVGLRKVGMISAALSTLGLSLLRRRGREGAGAVLLAGAVGLSLLKRED